MNGNSITGAGAGRGVVYKIPIAETISEAPYILALPDSLTYRLIIIVGGNIRLYFVVFFVIGPLVNPKFVQRYIT
jgi:hypothetical protein